MTIPSQAAAPPPDGVVPNFEHPQDVLHSINLVAGILGITIIAPFVIGRIFIKVYVVKKFVLEDYVCVVAWLLVTGYFMTGLFMGKHGGGYHEYEITKSQRVGFGQALYADTIVYGPCAWTTKTTLLLIFARIFAPYERAVKFVYLFIGFMFLYYFPVMIIKINICTPIAGLWDLSVKAKCLNQSKLFWFDTIMSAATDLVILLLPVPLIWYLHVPLRDKIRIWILLGAGGVATLASIVRLILVFQPNSFADETVSFVRFNLLGVAEVGIGIICACLPAFNVLLTRYTNSTTSQDSNPSAQMRSSRLRRLFRNTWPRARDSPPPPNPIMLNSAFEKSGIGFVELNHPQDLLLLDLEKGKEEGRKKDQGKSRNVEKKEEESVCDNVGNTQGESQEERRLRSKLSFEAINLHRQTLDGGVYDDEFRKVHEWMHGLVIPVIKNDEVCSAACAIL